MKEGWTYKKIKDVGEVIGGTTPSTTNPEFWGGDICWISPAELHGDHYLYDSVKKITPKAVSAKSLKELPVGTVILSSRAPIGKIAINKVPMYCNQGFKCVVCGPELYNEFLYWWFYGKVDYLNSLGTGATFKEISKTVVENIVVPIAPLEEQKRIVERLDAAFENIDKLKANAEKQLAEARTLFQKSLAKAMEPKEGWEEKALGDVCTLSQGLAINSHTKHLFIQNGSLPLLRIKDMKEGTREIFVDEASCPQGCIASEEDIIYTRTGTLGLVFTGMHGVLHNNCFKIKHDINKLNKSFLIYFLRNDSFVKTIIGLASRAAQPDITHKLFKAQEIHFPPLSEQQRIVERLDTLSENIRKYEEIQRQITSECDALKQALLRKVFE